jgi:uncharacterized protein YndB with AHSA1/START domain
MSADDDKPGRVRFSIGTGAPPERAFRALAGQAELASWFGTPTSPLQAGGRRRIDFGDGDFFELDDIELAPPTRLGYSWRFLGLSTVNLIGWTVAPRRGGGAIVTVTDDCEGRSPEGVAEMREGWRDFTGRLARFLETGERTRYDWRRELGGGVELAGGVDRAAVRLFAPDRLAAWQPWRASALAEGATLQVDDGVTPGELRLAGVDRRNPTELHFVVGAAQWKRPTRCALALQSCGANTMLTFSHVGWEDIGGTNEEQRRQRERFCRHWVKSMQRARSLVAQP